MDLEVPAPDFYLNLSQVLPVRTHSTPPVSANIVHPNSELYSIRTPTVAMHVQRSTGLGVLEVHLLHSTASLFKCNLLLHDHIQQNPLA